jgi:hypothetical protein
MSQDLSLVKKAGFAGFKTVKELWNDHSVIPNERGIYVVINPDCSMNKFLTKGVGGYFKEKDPNVSLSELTSNWVESSPVLYIGQAGGNGSSATLRKRLKQYLDFGKGKPVGHYGGRLIWQLAHHGSLIVAWKITPQTDPRVEEKIYINDFVSHYGKLPFANLTY